MPEMAKHKKGDTVKVKILAAVLLSALLLTIPPPFIENQAPEKEEAKAKSVQLAAPEKAASVESQSQTEQTAVHEEPPIDRETEAKAFIYFKESSNNPTAENKHGCYGLGQDCNGIVKEKCGTDYACQDAFFTEYMKRRYGTWQEAKRHWLAAVLINGKYVGHWW